jgi:hypothetical protein
MKFRKITPDEERSLEAAERLMARCQLLRAGVCEALKLGYPGPYDIATAIDVLKESEDLEKQARGLQRVGRPGKAKR